MMSEVLFTGEFKKLNESELEEILKSYKKINVSKNADLVTLLISMNVASSKREARELITSNAISINGNKVNDLEYVISDNDFMFDKYVIIKKGKKNYYVGVLE